MKWHDGKPFTADDLVFNWEYASDPATAADDDRQLQGRQGREGRRLSRSRSRFAKPTPFWADAFVGTRGMLIPKHLFADFKGAKSREAPANLKPVGTGPYPLCRLQARRHGEGRNQSQNITSATSPSLIRSK